MNDLFNYRSEGYELSSGRHSNFLIDASRLTMFDLKALARLVSSRITFGAVEGVPRGGLPFALALQSYVTPDHPRTLIVDDVYTTGASIRAIAGERQKAIVYDNGTAAPYDPRGLPAWTREESTLPPDMPHVTGLVIFSRTVLVEPWIKMIFRAGWDL